MNFNYSDSLCMVRDMARRFLADQTTVEAKVAVDATAAGYSAPAWADISKLGWLNLAGSATGEDIEVLGVLAEEVGRASFASPLLTCASASLVLGRLAGRNAEPDLQRIGAGECIAGLVWPDGARGALCASVSEAGLRVSGGPVVVEWGGALDYFMVPLRRADAPCVLRVGRQSPGLDIKPARPFDNARAAIVTFDNVTVPATDQFQCSADALDDVLGIRSLLIAAEAVGGAYGALDLTTAYVKERVQFARQIGSFQAVKHGLADARSLIDGAWLATWEGLSLAARGEPLGGSPALACWLAKRAFQDVAIKGAQYHGGMGHVIDSHMQFYYRRAGTLHGRCSSEWELLGQIAGHYVEPYIDPAAT